MSHNSRRHGYAVAPGNAYTKNTVPGVPTFTTAEEFIEKKIDMLQKDFRIELSLDDIIHLKNLKTEREINAAVRAIISNMIEVILGEDFEVYIYELEV